MDGDGLHGVKCQAHPHHRSQGSFGTSKGHYLAGKKRREFLFPKGGSLYSRLSGFLPDLTDLHTLRRKKSAQASWRAQALK
ncbi:hypothetical protein DRO22_02385 [Candidatus Bathyarchaeota archaeon]|nr:MAG: hypothetical protein DRO22_02385 [Candidatus Bathyarchaeota archaeon]